MANVYFRPRRARSLHAESRDVQEQGYDLLFRWIQADLSVGQSLQKH